MAAFLDPLDQQVRSVVEFGSLDFPDHDENEPMGFLYGMDESVLRVDLIDLLLVAVVDFLLK